MTAFVPAFLFWMTQYDAVARLNKELRIEYVMYYLSLPLQLLGSSRPDLTCLYLSPSLPVQFPRIV
jgi:hypothetical protein